MDTRNPSIRTARLGGGCAGRSQSGASFALTRSLVVLVCLGSGLASAEPRWVVDPGRPGPDLPSSGHSLFDRVVGSGPVPFPFEALIRRIESELAPGGYLGRPIKKALIPLGRSLQRQAAAPEPFRYPRAVVAVDGEPASRPGQAGLLLRDRLYLGYLEKAAVLEVISYNEEAGRFEYQVVRDYREDGARRVGYAPRTLCLSCHQNGSPIFARPLWDETNASPRVREHLAAQGRDFYGMPLDPGLDEAYAIDLATDRANGFALTQLLWSDGCGEGREGAACRGAMLLRAIQWGLSGGRGFDDTSPAYRGDLLAPLAADRDLQWPEGLKIPNPDIPNRRPLDPGRPLPDGSTQRLAATLSGDSDIPAAFEPLAPRTPLEVWRPGDRELTERAVSGLNAFLAGEDLRRLDDRLAALPAAETIISAACDLNESVRPNGAESLRLTCTDADLGIDARLVRQRDGRVSGRIPRLRLAGEDLGEVRLATGADCVEPSQSGQGDASLCLRPYRLGMETRLRLIDGRRVADLELKFRGEGQPQVRVAIAEDFAPLAAAVAALAEGGSPALSASPFRRPAVMDALLAGLGAPALAWCCADDARLPPPLGPERSSQGKVPTLEPFYRDCARCHRTPDPFPPNFLSGSPEQAADGLGQCAERIAYRLGMWGLEPDTRPKTPMPPHGALAARGIDPGDWLRGQALAALNDALSRLVAEQGRPLPDLSDLLARDYSGLRPCLAPTLAGTPQPSHQPPSTETPP